MARKLFYLTQSKGYWYAEQHTPDPDKDGKAKRTFTALGVKGTDAGAKRRAMRAMRVLEIETQRDGAQIPPDATVTVTEYLEGWLEELETSDIRPSTARVYALWAKRFAVRLGNVRLCDLTPKHIQEYKAFLQEWLKPRTVNTALRCVRTAFTQAVERDLIEKHPFRSVKEMNVVSREESFPPFWTPAQFRTFMATVSNDRYRLCFALAFYAGLRLGEVAALRWEDVNGERLTVTSHEEHRTKSGKPRKVPISPALAAELATWTRGTGAVLRRTSAFPNEGTISRAFLERRRAYDTAHQDAPLPTITFHGLRHSFATELATRGVPIPVLQRILGHARVTTTMLYMHVQEDSALEIAERIMRMET